VTSFWGAVAAWGAGAALFALGTQWVAARRYDDARAVKNAQAFWLVRNASPEPA
jgi:hypothetical protein